MKIGTFSCWLFGHKFYGEKIEFEPHYLKAAERGVVSTRLPTDFHMVGFQTDYCVRCGIDKPKK